MRAPYNTFPKTMSAPYHTFLKTMSAPYHTFMKTMSAPYHTFWTQCQIPIIHSLHNVSSLSYISDILPAPYHTIIYIPSLLSGVGKS